MKKIIAAVCLLLIIVVVFLCVSNDTTNFTGKMVENGNESNVNIIITNKRIYKLFNKISGNVCIQPENSNDTLKYNIMGSAFDLEDHYFASLMRYNEITNRMEGGIIYFDKGMENMVLADDSGLKVYSADDEFINIVRNRNDHTPYNI